MPPATRHCKDGKRRAAFGCTSFTFLGYTFRPRASRDRQGRTFLAFLPAISADALKRISRVVRHWRLHRRIYHTWEELAAGINPIVAGWMQYYGRFYRPRCIASWRASTPTWCDGSATSTGGSRASGHPGENSPTSPRPLQHCSHSGNGSAPPGDQDDKSPVTGDCHAGICGSRRVKSPPATRPWAGVQALIVDGRLASGWLRPAAGAPSGRS